MANSTVLTVAEWKARVNPSMDSSRDTELQLVINAATEWVKRIAGWEFEQPASAATIYLGGDDAIGPSRDILLVPLKYRPLIHSGGDLATITEDGQSLSVAVGYDTSADVILVNANENLRCELNRQNSPWSSGPANVVLTAKYGYATDDIPEELAQMVCEVATLMFRTPNFTGKGQRSHKEGSIAFEKQLSPLSQSYLEDLQERFF